MRRLNLSFFTEWSRTLTQFSASGPPKEAWEIQQYRSKCNQMAQYLKLWNDTEGMPFAIPATREKAEELAPRFENLPEDTSQWEGHYWGIQFKLNELETILNGELAVQATYHVWQKRAYDTNVLIGKATLLFSEDVRQWFLEDECYNIAQAGKCLALEVPTAAAFHFVRATESVIRRYYQEVVGNLPKPKMRNWGTYIKNLKACAADSKVIAALEQVKDLHRNPVIHPEERLSLDEALDLAGISVSVIGAIYLDMRRRQAAKESPQLPFNLPGSLLQAASDGGAA